MICDIWYLILYNIFDIIQYIWYVIYVILYNMWYVICDMWWYLGQPGRAKRAPQASEASPPSERSEPPKRGPKARASMHLIIMIYDCFWEPNIPSSLECTDVRSCRRHSLGGSAMRPRPSCPRYMQYTCNIWYVICDIWYYTIYVIFENKI